MATEPIYTFTPEINTGTTPGDGQGAGLRTNLRILIENDNALREYSGVNNSSQPDGLVSGYIAWQQGLIYYTTGLVARFSGVLYTLPAQTITLPNADATNGRFDLITIKLILINGNPTALLRSIQGAPSPNPSLPTIDFPEVEFAITEVFIPANSSSPQGVTNVLVYDDFAGEPNEFTVTKANNDAGVILADPTNPKVGTNAIKINFGLLSANEKITFLNDVLLPTADISNIKLSLLLNNDINGIAAPINIPLDNYISLRLFNGSTQVGTEVRIRNGVYGLNTSLLGVYQDLIIPMSVINAIGTTIAATSFNKFEMAFVGNIANTLYIDDFKIENGVVAANLNNNSIGISELKAELKNADTDLGDVSGTVKVDWNLGIQYKLNLTAALQIEFKNIVQGKGIMLIVSGNDAFSLIMPSGVDVASLVDFSTAASQVNKIYVYCNDAATPDFTTTLIVKL